MSEHQDWDENTEPYLVTQYTFAPNLGTVTFTALTVLDPNRVLSIYDTSVQPDPNAAFEFGTVMYLKGAGEPSVSGNVFYLPGGSVPSNASASDQLRIHYSTAVPEGWTLLNVANHSALPTTGIADALYLAMDTGQLWQWNGSAFVAV